MRISDWSSDVCSSDLALQHLAHAEEGQRNVQPQQLAMHASYTQAAVFTGGLEQCVDDFEADQAGPEAEALEQKPDVFIAASFCRPVEQAVGGCRRNAGRPGLTLHGLTRVMHAKTPYQPDQKRVTDTDRQSNR